MKIKLVFDDWRRGMKSIYQTEEGIEMSMGNFHSGTTFNAEIILDSEEEKDLRESLKSGATPVFYISKEVD